MTKEEYKQALIKTIANYSEWYRDNQREYSPRELCGIFFTKFRTELGSGNFLSPSNIHLVTSKNGEILSLKFAPAGGYVFRGKLDEISTLNEVMDEINLKQLNIQNRLSVEHWGNKLLDKKHKIYNFNFKI